MSDDRLTRGTMSLEQATISNIMWENAAMVEVLEGKELCSKQDPYDIITEFRQKNRVLQKLVTLSVIGNMRSGKYHLSHCSGYSQINPENRLGFVSEQKKVSGTIGLLKRYI